MKYILEQVNNSIFGEIDVNEARKNNHQLHFVGYIFVVSGTSSSTKVRMTTDSSMRTESGLSLNKVAQPAPGDVPSLQGILICSRCHPFYAVYNIKKFFRSVHTSDKDSSLRIICVPSNSFSSPPSPYPSWIYYRNQAISLGDSAFGDYATCTKVAAVKMFIHESPVHLQPRILQAKLEDTYINDGSVGAGSSSGIAILQDKISEILQKSGFCINSWECFSENIASKYLGMTWDRLNNHYLLKFCLNLHKKFRSIPSGTNLTQISTRTNPHPSPRRSSNQ